LTFPFNWNGRNHSKQTHLLSWNRCNHSEQIHLFIEQTHLFHRSGLSPNRYIYSVGMGAVVSNKHVRLLNRHIHSHITFNVRLKSFYSFWFHLALIFGQFLTWISHLFGNKIEHVNIHSSPMKGEHILTIYHANQAVGPA